MPQSNQGDKNRWEQGEKGKGREINPETLQGKSTRCGKVPQRGNPAARPWKGSTCRPNHRELLGALSTTGRLKGSLGPGEQPGGCRRSEAFPLVGHHPSFLNLSWRPQPLHRSPGCLTRKKKNKPKFPAGKGNSVKQGLDEHASTQHHAGFETHLCSSLQPPTQHHHAAQPSGTLVSWGCP